jgi:hypothetical protein
VGVKSVTSLECLNDWSELNCLWASPQNDADWNGSLRHGALVYGVSKRGNEAAGNNYLILQIKCRIITKLLVEFFTKLLVKFLKFVTP